MTKCPICQSKMKTEKKELEHGVYTKVDVCPKCADEWIDEKEYQKLYTLFKRRTFKIGGSVAVRIPQELASALKIGSGDEVRFVLDGKKLVIEVA